MGEDERDRYQSSTDIAFIKPSNDARQNRLVQHHSCGCMQIAHFVDVIILFRTTFLLICRMFCIGSPNILAAHVYEQWKHGFSSTVSSTLSATTLNSCNTTFLCCCQRKALPRHNVPDLDARCAAASAPEGALPSLCQRCCFTETHCFYPHPLILSTSTWHGVHLMGQLYPPAVLPASSVLPSAAIATPA
jgi:hypothetical protein